LYVDNYLIAFGKKFYITKEKNKKRLQVCKRL